MVGVDDLVKYLSIRRKEYIGACSLNKDRVISEMRSGKKFLEHCIRIYLEKNDLHNDIGKIALTVFELEEKEIKLIEVVEEV